MLNPDNDTLEWCAKWIEDSLRAETNERTIEFGKNMAMTMRAVKTNDNHVPSAAPVVDNERVEEIRRWRERFTSYHSDHTVALNRAFGYIDYLPERVGAAATAAPQQSDDEQLIALLLDWRKWYSEDLFTPWTIEEAQRVHNEFPGAVDRISAESARGTIDHIIEDIRAGKHRTTTEDNEEAR